MSPKKKNSKLIKTSVKKTKKKSRKKIKKECVNRSTIFGFIFVLILVFVFTNFGNQLRDSLNNGQTGITVKESNISESLKTYSPKEKTPQVVQEWETYFVNFHFLNIRKESNIKSEILTSLKEDDEVLGIKTDNPEWLSVILPDGVEGYAAKRYLTLLTKDVIEEKGLFYLPILMYHYVSVPPKGSDDLRENLSVSPAVLWGHLKYLKKNGYTAITLRDLQKAKEGDYPLPEKPIILSFDDGYNDHYQSVFPLLQKLNQKAVFFVITGKVGEEGYMNWDEIREMSDAGMEIGSHSKGDLDLRYVSEREGFDQIRDSKRILEQKLEKLVYSFSYPSGHYASWLFKVLNKSRYAFARTTEFGKYVNIQNHPYTLPTIRISQGTDEDQLAKWGIR